MKYAVSRDQIKIQHKASYFFWVRNEVPPSVMQLPIIVTRTSTRSAPSVSTSIHGSVYAAVAALARPSAVFVFSCSTRRKFWHWGKNIDRRYFITGCCGEYLDRRGMK
jgi:hypothetical protein